MFLSPLKYINQINCDQFLQKTSVNFNEEENIDKTTYKHRPFIKPKESNILSKSTNSSSKQLYEIKEEHLLFNICFMHKLANLNTDSFHSKTIFPVIKSKYNKI